MISLRHISTLLIIAAGFIILRAQTHFEPRIDVGGKGGITLSKTNFHPDVPQTMVTGGILGACFRYTEEDHFGLIGEFNIEQRGWKEKYENLDFAYNRRFTYIQIPMMTHIFFGNEKVRGFFNAGPSIGYMIAHSTSSNFDVKNIQDIENYPIENRESSELTLPVKYKVDYGICAGIGAEVQATPTHSLLIEGRFYYGLHDVFSNHKSDVFSASNAMSFQLSLGYFYRIK